MVRLRAEEVGAVAFHACHSCRPPALPKSVLREPEETDPLRFLLLTEDTSACLRTGKIQEFAEGISVPHVPKPLILPETC